MSAEDPDDAFTRFAIASEYLKRGNNSEALTFFEKLIQDHPKYVGTYYHAARLYASFGDREKATNIFEKGIRIAQENITVVVPLEEVDEE